MCVCVWDCMRKSAVYDKTLEENKAMKAAAATGVSTVNPPASSLHVETPSYLLCAFSLMTPLSLSLTSDFPSYVEYPAPFSLVALVFAPFFVSMRREGAARWCISEMK